jgi:hypothetical protein
VNRVGNFRFPYLGKFGFLLTLTQPTHAFGSRCQRPADFHDRRATRSSIVISRAAVTAELSSPMRMNVRFSTLDRGSAAWAVSIGLTRFGCSSVTTQRRSRFAFSPFARATAAIGTAGCRQADMTCALNSLLCVRRRRRTMPLSTPRRPPSSERRRMVPSRPSHCTVPLRAIFSPIRAGPSLKRQSHFPEPALTVTRKQ